MSASTVTKIEKPSRRVTVDELAALALALDVAPAALLLPADADPVTEVAIFAGKMLRAPFHLEITADENGPTEWSLSGGPRPPRKTAPQGRVERALRQAGANGDDEPR